MKNNEALFRIKQLVALAISFPYRHCCIEFPQRIRDEYNYIMSLKTSCIEFTNGCYIGEIHGNVSHGYGICIWNDGDLYIGEWLKGERTGEGILIRSDFVYIGNFSGGEIDGQGLEYSRNIGLELEAVYSKGKITKVLWASQSFKTEDGSVYDKDTNNFDDGKNGCVWIILVVILIGAIVKFFKWLF